MKYEPAAGETITETAKQMIRMAVVHGETVTATFNDIPLTAAMFGTTEESIVDGYWAESNRRHEAYKASPEGQKAAREAEACRKRAEASAAEGIKPFSLKDPDGWQKCIDNNRDGYGACCVRYAARWAHMMERSILAGVRLEAIAEETSHRADTEGITGFMYGCAVSMLAACWEHGEDLRRWHNLETQIGKEGERANESGGVLNPALLRVG